MKRWVEDISNNGKKIHSQAGQDGILEYIFSNLGDHINPFCIEPGGYH